MAFALNATRRKTGEAEALRAVRKIPAVVYGPQMSAVPVAVDYRAFERLYEDAGESSLIDCVIEGAKQPVKVLIQDVQFEPVKGRIVHADFRQINMNKEMQAPVPLLFVGESPAVKELGGTLIKTLEHVRVRCLPKYLVGHIDIDLSALKAFNDLIHVSDLVLTEGIVILDNPQTVLAKVAAPLTEEELKAMDEAAAPVDLTKIAVEEKGKKEEEGEEGAATAATAAGAKESPDKPTAGEKKEEKKEKKEKEKEKK